MKRTSLVALAAMLAMGSIGGSAAVVDVGRHAPRVPSLGRGTHNPVGGVGYATGPGWGYAKVKRMARKRRNQLRNRRAHRGA